MNTTTPRLIEGSDLALILDAVENHEQARTLIYGLQAGTLLIAYSGPDLPVPPYCSNSEIDITIPGGRGHLLLTLALSRAVGRWSAMGHSNDMADCMRLLAGMETGSLQLISNHTVSASERP